MALLLLPINIFGCLGLFWPELKQCGRLIHSHRNVCISTAQAPRIHRRFPARRSRCDAVHIFGLGGHFSRQRETSCFGGPKQAQEIGAALLRCADFVAAQYFGQGDGLRRALTRKFWTGGLFFSKIGGRL